LKAFNLTFPEFIKAFPISDSNFFMKIKRA